MFIHNFGIIHWTKKYFFLSEFKKNIRILIGYYCHTHVIEGHHINGILDADKLHSQAKCFVNNMMERQFGKLEDPLSNGCIIRLWSKLDRSDTLKEHMS